MTAGSPGSGQGVDRGWRPGAVRRLFDKELDNNHEEPLLVAQLAAQQLRRLFATLPAPATAALRAAVLPWLMATLEVQFVLRGPACQNLILNRSTCLQGPMRSNLNATKGAAIVKSQCCTGPE